MGMAKLVMKNTTEEGDQLKFNWTVGTESAMDSSFFWGYLITQVPGGFLASLYPANRIFGAAIAISSFLNLLVPGALKVDPIVDMIVQAMKGFVEVRYISYLPTYITRISIDSIDEYRDASILFRASHIQPVTVFGNSGRHPSKDRDWPPWHFAVRTPRWL